MTKSRFFRHIDPPQTAVQSSRRIEAMSKTSTPLANAIWEAGEMAVSAMTFFRGIFPKEAPYFVWGEGAALPWHCDYAQGSGCSERQQLMLFAEVNAIAGELRRLAGPTWLVEPPGQLTYQSGVLCESPKLMVQGLAVETLLCVDGLLERLASNRPAEALAWQATAFRNLVEAVLQVHEIPHAYDKVPDVV